MSHKVDKSFDYEGSDLEAMMLAGHYYKWIAHAIEPFIGVRVVEIGAGVGSFSKFIDGVEKKFLLIEPSKRMFSILKENVKDFNNRNVQLKNSYLHDAGKTLIDFKPDTFVYVNVFEHIEDDIAEINKVSELLGPNGHVIIFVPALPALYSDFDKSIDHYRRYTKKSLKALADNADLEVVKLRYMDMPGILPWWLSFVVMKRTKLVPVLVRTYDGFCVPIIRFFETILKPPVGKNILLVAKKKLK